MAKCTCDEVFKQLRYWKITMRGMNKVAIKQFIPQPFNKWACKKCEKVHTKDW